MRRVVCLLLVTMLATSIAHRAHAREDGPPTNIPAFTTYFAADFTRALPEGKVAVKGPLTLNVVLPPRPDAMIVDLSRIWSYCARVKREDCQAETEPFVNRIVNHMRAAVAPIDKSTIRVIVRNADYLKAMRKRVAAIPGAEPVARLVAGDLWRICVIDKDVAVELLGVRDLPRLGLSEDEAIALGERNVAAELPPGSQVITPLAPDGIGYITGHFYDSSRLVLHEDWAALAKQMNGRLVVAVPVKTGILYIEGKNRADLEALKRMAEATVQGEDEPISTQLLHWLPIGWEVVAP